MAYIDICGKSIYYERYGEEHETALLYLSVVGNILIFSVGINLLFGKKIKVANFLPSLLFAIIAAFLPINLI